MKRSPWLHTSVSSGGTGNYSDIPLISLALPLIVENLLRVSLSSVDILMLSGYSQEAVAAIGFVSQFSFFIVLLHNVIGIGTSIVISQYVGARRLDEAREVSRAGTLMVTIAGIAIAVIFGALTGPILSLYSLEPLVYKYSYEYFVIYALFSFTSAISVVQSAILRSYGYAKDTMFVNIASNIINIIGNALALYGFFGLPVFGVPGVAISTVFSQFCGCVFLGLRIRSLPEVRFSLRKIWKVNSNILKKIISIGVPTAGENLSYNISQIVIMAIITTFGTFAMSAYTYLQTIIRFVYTIANSIGSAVQIKIGYFVGERKKDTAYTKLYGYQAWGTLVSVVFVVLLIVFKEPVMSIFHPLPEISAIIYSLLPVCLIMETSRSVNLVTIPALKGAGDIQYPVIIGILSMWLVSVVGGWIMAVPLNMGLMGIWIMMAADETIRAIIFLLRWKSKKWMKKNIL